MQRIIWQQFPHGGVYMVRPRTGETDRRIGAHELAEDLAAGAAGAYGLSGIRCGNGKGGEGALAMGHGLDKGVPFGAEGEAEGAVFHVAAGKDGSVFRKQGRSHTEMGIGRVSKSSGPLGFLKKCIHLGIGHYLPLETSWYILLL